MFAERTWRRDAVVTGAAMVVVATAFMVQWPVPVLLLVDLAVHEVARLLSAPLPVMATALSGWIAQVALPVFFGCYFLVVRGDRVIAGFAFAWAGAAARDVAAYAGDAAAQTMGRIGSASEWAFILGPQGLDVLDRAEQVGSAIWSVGALLALGGVLLAASGAVRSMADHERRIDLDRVLAASGGVDPWDRLLRSAPAGDPWRASVPPTVLAVLSEDERIAGEVEPVTARLLGPKGEPLPLVVDVADDDDEALPARRRLLLSSRTD